MLCLFLCRTYLTEGGKGGIQSGGKEIHQTLPYFNHVSSRQMQCTVIDFWILGFSLFQPICVVYHFPVFSFLKRCMAIVKTFFTFMFSLFYKILLLQQRDSEAADFLFQSKALKGGEDSQKGLGHSFHSGIYGWTDHMCGQGRVSVCKPTER